MGVQCATEARKDARSPRARVKGSWKSSGVDAGNCT